MKVVVGMRGFGDICGPVIVVPDLKRTKINMITKVEYLHLSPLPSFQPPRRSFWRASYRKEEDRREIDDRVYGRRGHNFLPNVQN